MQRAREAEQLLANPLLREALYLLEQDVLQQMRHVKLDDTEGHQRLVLALQMQRAVERRFWAVIQEGHSAGEQIQLRGRRID